MKSGSSVLNEKNIILTGFMATGKSAVGRELAGRLNRTLVDTDSLIEEMCSMTVEEIFSCCGEEYFRERESEAVARLDDYPAGSLVVSTGGGILLRQENRRRLVKNGLLVLLSASPREILRRALREGGRPLLEVPDPEERIRDLLARRKDIYSGAAVHVDTTNRTVSEVASGIIEALRRL
ncbi:MAG TPA: shikimate kinase [Firmicutes bacterium]|nr:shikimate kinase [Bacillota bacterium]